MKILTLTLLMACFGCSQAIPPRAVISPKPKPDKNACLNEPNGDKPWYPEDEPFFPEGYAVLFDGWPAICQSGKWITNEPEYSALRRRKQDRADLIWAARTRVLNAGEMQRLRDEGAYIFIEEGRTYRQEDIDRQYSELIQQQIAIRLMADKRNQSGLVVGNLKPVTGQVKATLKAQSGDDTIHCLAFYTNGDPVYSTDAVADARSNHGKFMVQCDGWSKP